MARLAAKTRVLFYPTPVEIMDLIVSNIVSPASGPDDRIGTILDPCAGDGFPVAMLGNHLGLTTYGCELHPERYEEANGRLVHCLNGAREYLDIEGQFTMLFDNPPYDQTLEGTRMELDHIKLDLDLLQPDGVGIWVIPDTIITWDLCNLLLQHLKQVNIRKFPEPFYADFKQVVIFGVKRVERSTYTYTQTQELEAAAKSGFPDLKPAEFAYEVILNGNAISRFEMNFPNVATVLDEIEANGITTLDTWEALTSGTGQGIERFQPILRLTSGHAAMAIAAGIVNGAEVQIEGEPYLIKGSTTKRLKVTREVESDGEDTVETTREREQLVQQITAFNLDNGRFTTYNSLDDKEGFADFLLTHQQTLVDMIEARYPPLFEPDRDMHHWVEPLSRVRAPGKLPGQEAAGLLPAQQVRAAALATRLRDHKSVVLIGEMGTGVR